MAFSKRILSLFKWTEILSACGILRLGNKGPLRIFRANDQRITVVCSFPMLEISRLKIKQFLEGSATTAVFVRHQHPSRRLGHTVRDVERAAGGVRNQALPTQHHSAPHQTSTTIYECLRSSVLVWRWLLSWQWQSPEPLLDRVQSISRHVSTAIP